MRENSTRDATVVLAVAIMQELVEPTALAMPLSDFEVPTRATSNDGFLTCSQAISPRQSGMSSTLILLSRSNEPVVTKATI